MGHFPWYSGPLIIYRHMDTTTWRNITNSAISMYRSKVRRL